MRSKSLYVFLTLLLGTTLCYNASAQFMRGADISSQTRQEEGDEYTAGVLYSEYGVTKDAVTILKNHDMDWVRLRLFHTPDMGDYGASMDLEKALLVASVRGFIQLIAIGYVLELVFNQDSPVWTTLLLVIMIVIAARTSGRRGKQTPHAAWIARGR